MLKVLIATCVVVAAGIIVCCIRVSDDDYIIESNYKDCYDYMNVPVWSLRED